MKEVYYEEEGVASAVGAIFAILIFIFLLSLFVTSYVPAEMRSYEEQYSSGVMNDMMQFMAVVSLLSLNYQQGQIASVTFDLQSGYLPIFSSPTLGTLNITPSSPGISGYIEVGNSTSNITAGGSLSVLTNDRYFVDEAFSYELSSLFYEQYGSRPMINSTIQFNLIRTGVPANGSINLSMDLVNLVGGPMSISSASPFVLTVEALSSDIYSLEGNITLTLFSQMNYQVYHSIYEAVSLLPGMNVSHSVLSGNIMQISLSSNSVPINLHVTEITVLVGINSSS